MKKIKIGLIALFVIGFMQLFNTDVYAASKTYGDFSKGASITLDDATKCTSTTTRYFYNPNNGRSDCSSLTMKWGPSNQHGRATGYNYIYYKAYNTKTVSETGTASTDEITDSNLGPGVYKMQALYSTQQGWGNNYEYTATVTVTVKKDTTAPTCALADNTKWYKDGDTVKINCNDLADDNKSGSGCWNSTSQSTYTYVNKTVSGGKIASFTMVDRMGNSMTCASGGGCMNVDNEAPICGGTVKNANAWTKSKVIQWSCSDTVTKSCGNISAPTCTNSSKDSETVYANGDYTNSECKDSNGNSGTRATVTVKKIDRKTPTCTLDTTNYPTEYLRTSFTATATCKDNGTSAEKSGCVKDTYTVKVTSDQSNTITVKDNVGWEDTCTFKYDKYDSTGPVVTISLEDAYKDNSSTKQAHADKVMVNISATDNKSGINRLCYTLSGATTQAETCVEAEQTTVAISKNGTTRVTAYAYDNAYDYDDTNKETFYNSGNRSADAIQDVYIDNTKPTIVSVTKPTNNWQSSAYPVTIVAKDNESGMGTVEAYWSTSNDITKTFGAANKDKVDGETLPFVNTGGTKVRTHVNGSGTKEQTVSEVSETNVALSGKMYLHVRACDLAYGPNGTSKPNCTTGVYGPYLYDGNAAAAISVNAGSIDWTNKFSLTITAQDESYSGKEGSGLSKIKVYFNADSPFMNTVKANAVYTTTPTVANNNCNSSSSCIFTLDFTGLKSNPTVNGEPIKVVDGIRFIKVVAVDGVGNESEAAYFGPYKWDTTAPKPTNDPTFNGITNGTYMPYNY